MKTVKYKCNRETLNKRRKAAISFFNTNYPTFPEKADDFGSYCVEKWLSGRSEAIKLRFLAIDYMRLVSAPRPSKSNKSVEISVDAMRMGTFQLKEINPPIATCDLSKFHAIELINSCWSLTKQERAILILVYRWGFNNEEVSYAFGVSPASISVFRKIAEKKIRSSQ